MDLIGVQYMDGGMSSLFLSYIMVFTGVVSKAIQWMVSGKVPVEAERLRKPFQTRRAKGPSNVLPRAPKFKFDIKDARSSKPVEGVDSEMRIVVDDADESKSNNDVDLLVESDPQLDIRNSAQIETVKSIDLEPKTSSSSKSPAPPSRRGRKGSHRKDHAQRHASGITIPVDAVKSSPNEREVKPSESTTQESEEQRPPLAAPWDVDDTPRVDESVGLVPKDTVDINSNADQLPLLFAPFESVPPNASEETDGVVEKFSLPKIKRKLSFKIKESVVTPPSTLPQPDVLDVTAQRIQTTWRRSREKRLDKLAKVVHKIFDPYFIESAQVSPSPSPVGKRESVLDSINALYRASQKIPDSPFR